MLFWVLFFMAVPGVLTGAAVYRFLDFFSPRLSDAPLTASGLLEIQDVLQLTAACYLPVVAGVFLLSALLLWLCLRLSLSRLAGSRAAASSAGQPAAPSSPGDTSGISPEQREARDRRLFLHLLSMLQQKGRLLDFFKENLADYDDGQVGAAVRHIHESCGGVLKTYVQTAPVLSEEEDSRITVEAGFDPNAVKLTGNVTGEPPFTGFVRHRGWKAVSVDPPSFSVNGGHDIIAPAEVEII